VSKEDSTVAAEVLLEIFTQIYMKSSDKGLRQKLGSSIENILKTSTLFDYGAVSTVHRIAIELLKCNDFVLDPLIVRRTATQSLSFQTGIVLLEESIISRGEESYEE